MASLVTMYRRIFPYTNQNVANSEVSLTSSQTMKEKAISKLLSPFESYVVSVQSILIWENPYLSGITLLLVNFLFCVIVAYSHRFYSIVATIGIVIFVYRTWVNQIWPEIRVPPADDDDTEEWTPVNPQVFSVPEISRYLSQFTSSAKKWYERLVQMRQDNPGQFCVLMTGLLSVLLIVGNYVSGVFIAYILVMSIMLAPGFIIHIVPKISTFLANSNLSCSTFKFPLPIMTAGSNDSDSQDSELNEFLPEPSSQVMAALDSALVASDDEISEPHTIPSASLLDEDMDELALPEKALDNLPNMDGDGDSGDESILPEEEFALPSEPTESEIRFVPTHFDDSDSDDDVKEFAEGLHFTDSQDSTQFNSQQNYADNDATAHSLVSQSNAANQSLMASILQSPDTQREETDSKSNKKSNVHKDQMHRFSESVDSDLTDFEIVSESELATSTDE